MARHYPALSFLVLAFSCLLPDCTKDLAVGGTWGESRIGCETRWCNISKPARIRSWNKMCQPLCSHPFRVSTENGIIYTSKQQAACITQIIKTDLDIRPALVLVPFLPSCHPHRGSSRASVYHSPKAHSSKKMKLAGHLAGHSHCHGRRHRPSHPTSRPMHIGYRQWRCR